MQQRLTNYQLGKLVNYRLREEGLPEVKPQQIYSVRRGQPDLLMEEAPAWIERYIDSRKPKTPKRISVDEPTWWQGVELKVTDNEYVVSDYVTQLDLSKGCDLLDFLFPDGCDEDWSDSIMRLLDHVGITPDMVRRFDIARRGWINGADPKEWLNEHRIVIDEPKPRKKGKKGKGKKS